VRRDLGGKEIEGKVARNGLERGSKEVGIREGRQRKNKGKDE
jgi:hypothetical protein